MISPIYDTKDFTIQAEKYGIPQTRHRVILLGIRNDIGFVPGNTSGKRQIDLCRKSFVRITILGEAVCLKNKGRQTRMETGFRRNKEIKSKKSSGKGCMGENDASNK